MKEVIIAMGMCNGKIINVHYDIFSISIISKINKHISKSKARLNSALKDFSKDMPLDP